MTIPFAAAPLVERIGWLLVHSVWQFTLIALLLAVALRVLRTAPAGARYAATLVGWSLMLAVPALTWPLLPDDQPAAVASTAPATPVGVPPSGGQTILNSVAAEAGTSAIAPFPVAAPPSGGQASIDSDPAEAGTRTSPTWTESLNAVIAPWLNTLVVIWCLGVCIFAARSARGWHIVRQLLQRDVQAVPDELTSLLVRVLKRVGLRHRVRLLQSPHVDVPLVVGWLRPVILLPVCVATGFSPAQLEAILAHELAHIRRHDYLINLLQTLSETVFFYHPALWWASAMVRREREHCCDELAARALGNPAEYGRALLALEELRGEAPALALGAKGGSLLERVRRLAQLEPTPRFGAGGVIGIAVLIAATVAAVACVAGSVGEKRFAIAGLQTIDTDAAAGAIAADVPEASRSDAEQTSAATTEPSVPMTTVSGVAIDTEGAGQSAVRIEAQYYGGEGLAHVEKTTDVDGRFAFTFPSDRLRGIVFIGSNGSRSEMGITQLPWELDASIPPEVTVTLKPALRADVRVADTEGRPVDGAKVNVRINHPHLLTGTTDAAGTAAIMVPADAEIHEMVAGKHGFGLDYRSWFDRNRLVQKQPQMAPDLTQPVTLTLTKTHPLTVTVLDADASAPLNDTPVAVWLFRKPGEVDSLNVAYYPDDFRCRTDASGVATIDWIPAWLVDTPVIINANSPAYEHRQTDYVIVDRADALTIALHRLVPLSGRVTFADGRPAPGIKLHIRGEGYNHESFYAPPLTTDAGGRYEVNVAPNQAYLIAVDDRQWAAPAEAGFVVLPGQPKDGVDLTLQPATRLFGRVTIGADEKPIVDQLIASYQEGSIVNLKEAGVELPADADQIWGSPHYSRSTKTDADGRYELFVGPGKYDLRATAQNEIVNFEITDETEREFNFHAWRPENGPFSGVVVAGDPPRPVPNAKVSGIYRYQLAGGDIDVTTDAIGGFQITRELHATVLQAVSEDGTQAALVEIGPDDASVTIQLQPRVSAAGRLIDGETSEPLANATIQYHTRVHLGGKDDPFRQAFGGSVTTDDRGNFTLDRLVAGTEFDVTLVAKRDSSGFANQWRSVTQLTPSTPGETINLGDVVAKPAPKPYTSPTLADRIATAFHKTDTAATRYQNSLRDIRIGHLRLLLIVADPEAELTQQFFQLRYDDEEVRSATDNYWLTPLPLTGEKSNDTFAFAGALGLDVSDPAAPVFVVIDEQEQRLATVTATELSTNGAIDKQKVLDLFAAHVPGPLDAQVLFNDALARARAENKRVFVQESATWCGPCWMLSRFVHAHRDLLEQDYIFVKLDHRWPHSQEIAAKFQKEQGGIPWCAILDADQNVLATSDGPDGNIGFPAKDEPQGIEHFLKMLRDSRIRLTNGDLEALRAALEGKGTAANTNNAAADNPAAAM